MTHSRSSCATWDFRSLAFWLAGVALALALAPVGLFGQQVELRKGSQGSALADGVLEAVLERRSYALFVRDTVLAADAVIDGDVLVIGASLRVEGRIVGDLVGVQSDIFARPGARIDGSVVVMGGGFYGSSLAELGARPIDAARYAYAVQLREDGSYLITAPGSAARVSLPGLYGLLVPLYDRVNALTLLVGVDLDRGGSVWLPDASLRVRYRSVRQTFDGDLDLAWPFGRHTLKLRGGRGVRSNDRWINGDIENSVYAIVGAVDTRNYYDAYFADAGIRLGFGSGTLWLSDFVFGWERARSLENRDPFSIFDARAGGFQPNLPVIEADIASFAFTGTVGVWGGGGGGQTPGLDAELSFEVAEGDVAGDLSFALLGGALRAEIGTTGDQTLLLEGRGQYPLSDDAPPQRWQALGAWGSLPTVVPTGRAGDRMWWVGATYRVPVGKDIGRLGRLVPWLQYVAGNAWSNAAPRPSAVHDIGLGLSLGPLSVAVYTAPSDDFRTVLAIGLEARRWPSPRP